MPENLERCVKKVMAEHGYSEQRAYAVCTASLADDKDHDMTTPRKARREDKRRRAAAHRLADMRHKASLAQAAVADLAAEIGEPDETDALAAEPEVKAVADEKCCGDAPMVAYQPFGGATTIADALAAKQAQKTAWAIQDAAYLLQDVVNNILADDEIADKGAAVGKAAAEFQALLENPAPLMKAVPEPEPEPDVPADAPVAGETKDTLWQRFTGWLKGLAVQPELAAPVHSSFVVLKDDAGNYRWLGRVSNNFRDLDGEIITEAAHKEFVAYLDAHPGQAPELWTWHVPGTARAARADWWDYADGFLTLSGPLTSAEAKAFAEDDEPLGMSHGFFPLARDVRDRLILKYRTFEASELPLLSAANPFTGFDVMRKELTMPFSKDKRALLVKRLGEAQVAQLEAGNAEMQKALAEIGVESKDAAPQAKQADMDACMEKHKKMGHDEATAHKMCLEETGDGEKSLAAEVKALAGAVAELKQLVTAQAETKAAADKAQSDKLAALETAITAAAAGVAELKGELPRGQRAGFRASEQGDAPPPELKAVNAEPSADPFEKHWQALTRAAQQPATGGQ